MATPGSDHTYGQQQPNSDDGWLERRTMASIILVGFLLIVVLAKAIHRLCSHLQVQERPEGVRGPAPNNAGADPAQVLKKVHAAGPVVCVYRRSDGWLEAMCPVCLSDFADGEAVSVLPACMHYFHAACVGEWLRARATCPLCRAAPATSGVV
ncbi:E3 ubiquitin-protein ligase ATL59-like [Aegilops tauschii subsp. strangulata]|uniref:E3 ubiquitin-protein ligase ATL59-like n=1 Tax=Aegilops tauschii subsp. strangulata TaxID=200361 RepID=UPI00098BC2FF|nr:E3 ubiquitin-protein ligase ATL59-like [Aegilops tauschii subsp. strangulata]